MRKRPQSILTTETRSGLTDDETYLLVGAATLIK